MSCAAIAIAVVEIIAIVLVAIVLVAVVDEEPPSLLRLAWSEAHDRFSEVWRKAVKQEEGAGSVSVLARWLCVRRWW